MLNMTALQRYLVIFGFVALLPLAASSPQALAQLMMPRVIYGEDERMDLYEVDSFEVLELARATVALIDKNNLDVLDLSPMSFGLKGAEFGEKYELCEEERFREQKTSARCSGFLVGPDLVVTAGHCMMAQEDCRNTQFVFDFALHSPGTAPEHLSQSQVYHCAEVVTLNLDARGTDFAVVRLNRAVTDRKPLKLSRERQLSPGDPLMIIGHPVGLPTKVAPGGSVRESGKGKPYFVANLDSYGGNSGSAVINEISGKVEGILVRGEVDFERRDSCRVSKRCPHNQCRGEDVIHISEVLPYL